MDDDKTYEFELDAPGYPKLYITGTQTASQFSQILRDNGYKQNIRKKDRPTEG